MELPSRQVVADEAVGEVAEPDVVGLAEAFVDGSKSLAELALRPALGPLRRWPERLEHLLARRVAVLDPPDGTALAFVADDSGSSRHQAPPPVEICGRCRRKVPASCSATQ